MTFKELAVTLLTIAAFCLAAPIILVTCLGVLFFCTFLGYNRFVLWTKNDQVLAITFSASKEYASWLATQDTKDLDPGLTKEGIW